MAFTVQDVLNVYPGLAAYAATSEGSAAILRWLQVAVDTVPECGLGNRYGIAVALLAAHLVLSNTPGLGGLVSGGGIIQSASVGQTSVTYAATTTTRGTGRHGSTIPGASYDELLDGALPAFIYLPGNPC